jgi:hypothetical protein
LPPRERHAFDLDLRGGLGHDDGRLDPQFFRRQRQALGVIARRGRDHAPRQFFRAQLRQFVVRAANLEGEDWLQVFALEQDLVAEPLGQLASTLQRGFHGNVVNAGGEDFLDVLFEHLESITGEGARPRSLPRDPTHDHTKSQALTTACRYNARPFCVLWPPWSPA